MTFHCRFPYPAGPRLVGNRRRILHPNPMKMDRATPSIVEAALISLVLPCYPILAVRVAPFREQASKLSRTNRLKLSEINPDESYEVDYCCQAISPAINSPKHAGRPIPAYWSNFHSHGALDGPHAFAS